MSAETVAASGRHDCETLGYEVKGPVEIMFFHARLAVLNDGERPVYVILLRHTDIVD